MTTLDKLSGKLSELGIQLIAGREGLRKNVMYITIMELPERTERFKKNGLVLGTFHSFKSDEEMKCHIEWLQSVGIIGIGFHIAHFKTVPDKVVQHAEKINMPLFIIPADVPYHKILDIFNQCENEDLNLKTHEIHKISEKIMESVYYEKDTGFIINLMGNYINKTIVFLDAFLKVQALWQDKNYTSEEIDQITRLLISDHKELLLQTRFFKRERQIEFAVEGSVELSLLVIPVFSKDGFKGYLIVSKDTLDDYYNNEVIRLGLKAISFGSQEHPNSKKHNKMKDIGKLEDLLDDTSQNFTSNDFNISLENLTKCIRVIFTSEKIMKDALSALSEILLNDSTNGIAWIYKGSLIIFIESEIECESVFEILNLYNGKSIGLSSRFNNTSITDLRLMSVQAATAMAHTEHKEGKLISWNEMGIEKVAYNISDNLLFKQLDDELLQKLIIYDKEKNGELLTTLESSLKHFFNLKAVGEELYIHPNTVKYRLGQIEKLLDISMYDHTNYALLVMALSIYRRNNMQ